MHILITYSVSAEKVPGIDFFFDVIQNRIIAVGNDTAAHGFEFLQIIDHAAAEEGASVFQGRLIDHDRGAFGLDPLHNALDRRLTEIVAVALHGEPVDTDRDAPLPVFLGAGIALAVAVGAGDFQDSVGDKVLPGTVAFYNGLNQVFRDIPVICQKLLGVLRQAVSAVPEGRIVVKRTDSRVEADPLMMEAVFRPFSSA